MKSGRWTRREFLAWLAAGSTGLIWGGCTAGRGRRRAPPSETVLHACVGAGGMGASDLNSFAHHSFVRIVAVADVDLPRAEVWRQKFPQVRIYQDWRQLLERERDLDSLSISTPDHMHAPIAMAALQRGLHLYVQKPLTHDVYEARQLARMAARNKGLVTQMGIQIQSLAEYRQAVAILRSGLIGKVREVHLWSDKEWGDPTPLPDRRDPVPPGLDWDGWLGVAAWRPYIGDGYYHPGNWRRRLDFGTGTLGDMGCHIFDPVFLGLELTAPVALRSEGPAPNAWNWANHARVEYLFPGTRYTLGPSVKLTWYDGQQRPPREVLERLEGEPLPPQGSLCVGTEGVLLLPHIGRPRLFPRSRFEGVRLPEIEGANHYTQFLEAVRGRARTTAAFAYAGPLTETVLLGCLATRFPHMTLEWDAEHLRFKNVARANHYLRRPYRAGWTVRGL